MQLALIDISAPFILPAFCGVGVGVGGVLDGGVLMLIIRNVMSSCQI